MGNATENTGLRTDGYVIVDYEGGILSDEYGGATRYRSTSGSWTTLLKRVFDDARVLACVEEATVEVINGLAASRQLGDSLRSLVAVVGNIHGCLCGCSGEHEGWSFAEMEGGTDDAFDNEGNEVGRDDDSDMSQERSNKIRKVWCWSVSNEQDEGTEVCQAKVTEAYLWLKETNPQYLNVEWDEDNANTMRRHGRQALARLLATRLAAEEEAGDLGRHELVAVEPRAI